MESQPDLTQEMCRPEGAIEFVYTSPEAFGLTDTTGVIFHVVAGGHLFHIDRTNDRMLRFFHFSPGTGTRVATISLEGLPDFDKAWLFLGWSPAQTVFSCGPLIPDAKLLSANGEYSSTQLRNSTDGEEYQVGDNNVKVFGLRIKHGKDLVLTSTAIETWNDTLWAIEVLKSGKSDNENMFVVLQSNITINMLVTGLETYTKKRLLEIRTEGIEANWQNVFVQFTSKAERESKLMDEIYRMASESNISPLELFIQKGKINFQSYDHIKRAYKAAYDIKIGEIGIASSVLETIQQVIRYRHRITHVSPLLSILNEDNVPPEAPIFASKVVENATNCFRDFVQALHNATLTLRNPEKKLLSNESSF